MDGWEGIVFMERQFGWSGRGRRRGRTKGTERTGGITKVVEFLRAIMHKSKPNMYFPDLTPYQYNLPKPLDCVAHVGWLDGGEPFETGPSSQEFRSMLRHWFLNARCNQFPKLNGLQLGRLVWYGDGYSGSAYGT